jgi:competence protein ComEA
VYAVLTLAVVLLGARALRAGDTSDPSPPVAVVDGAQAADGTSTGAPAPDPGTAEAPGPGAGMGAGAPAEPGQSAASGAGTAPGAGAPDLLVHVAGAVRRPGVYRMPAGARIQDALTSAGGPRREADYTPAQPRGKGGRRTAGADPAPRAADRPHGADVRTGLGLTGARLRGDRFGHGGRGARGRGRVLGDVDLNSATIAELETLDGVGPAIAQKIVDWREANGGFRSVDDLAQVAGIGPKKLEAMRPRVGV